MTDSDIEVKKDEKPKHPVVEKIKEIIAFFQALTSEKETDNIWVIRYKILFQRHHDFNFNHFIAICNSSDYDFCNGCRLNRC